jgi:hypothetical protein
MQANSADAPGVAEGGCLKKCQLGKEICKSTDREDEVGITVKVSFTQH